MKTNRKDTGRRLLQLLADYKLFLFAILILSIIQVGLTVYLPILIGRAVDSIIAEGQVSFANLETILMQMIIVVIANTLVQDRKSTRLDSSHVAISYVVFCLKKKALIF